MAGTTSKISISSNALILLGHQPISSFDEPGSGPQAATNLYEMSYLNLLSMHRWRFTVRKAQLARLTESPLNGYTYQFQLPSDFLYLVRTEQEQDYEIYQDKLFTNRSSVSIDYQARVNEDNLPPYFVKTFEFYLAMQFAIPVTGNSTRASEYREMFKSQLSVARYLDSTQRPNEAFIDSPYTEIRF